jgi:prolyl-tRNA synthetase
MLFSKSFIFTSRDVDQDITTKSHALMIKAGLIAQESNGIFYFLPLLTGVMENIEKIIDKNMERFGCCKMIVPTLQSAERWKESGRYDAYGNEMLRVRDRHNRELLYSPTAEEGMFYVAKKFIHSYRDLPKYLYQVHWKFRDEMSPRNGLLRGREFLMKDGYSFDKTLEESLDAYLAIYNSYVDIFRDMSIEKNCVFAKADAGAIGGSLNHEIIFLNNEGDCEVWYQEDSILHNISSLQELNDKSAVIDENHKDPNKIYKYSRGTEVGHIFNYADKYSQSMKAFYRDKNNQDVPFYGGCYGIGVSRLLAVIVDGFADEFGIRWPSSIAPFQYHIIYKEEHHDLAMDLHSYLGFNNSLLDDRDCNFAVKMHDGDLLGMPMVIILGKNWEKKCRASNITECFSSFQELKNSLVL